MNIYQDAAGNWILFDGEEKHIFTTQQEARTMSDKLNKATSVQAVVTTLGNLDDLLDIINAREYGQGQAQAVTDDDVAALNITAADFFNALNLLDQIKTLLTNGVPAQDDYMAIVNRVRSD